MKSFFDLNNDEGEILGPGTDLVISLVAVLMMILALSSKSSQQKISELEKIVNGNSDITEQLLDNQSEIKKLKDSILKLQGKNNLVSEQDIILKKIRESQVKIINEIANEYNTKPKIIGKNEFEIEAKSFKGNINLIKIKNDATLQRISFGNSTLFKSNKDVLRPEGKSILYNTARVFKDQLNLIKEIQIQGHADADQKSLKMKNDNMNLAGRRAISIVRFFRDDSRLRIDPSKYVLYASSFGFYMPVERDYVDNNWDLSKVKRANEKRKGDLNRRIEIVLNYKELVSDK